MSEFSCQVTHSAKVRGMLAVISVFVAQSAFSATYTLKNGASDWESSDSYEEGTKPSPGDTVKIPADTSAKVDDDSIAFVSSLARVLMPSATSALEIDISTNAVLSCQMTGKSAVAEEGHTTAIGTVTKKGAGELFLDSAGNSNDYRSKYYANWTIEEGSLRMPTNCATATTQLYFGSITVNKGATLYTAKPGRTYVKEIWGEGLITNVSESANYYLDVHGFNRSEPCVFLGEIGGAIQLYSRGVVHLAGTNNTFRGPCWCYEFQNSTRMGTVGLKTIGMAGQPSSAGAGSALRTRENSGRFLYIGTGETTDRTIMFDESDYRPCEFDAGAVGGITFTGKWEEWETSSAKMNRLVLSGSNTSECVLANAMNTYDGFTKRITKKGSGTWRLAHHTARKNAGVIAVQDGVLKFDSIAEQGNVCSLGLSTVLYADYTGAKKDEMKVDYALMLGGDSSKTGTLEYAGADTGVCKTRPLMVSGAGRLQVKNGSLTLGGVFADHDNGGTLIFNAENSGTNRLADVADGTNGVLSIVKEGSGTLALCAGQTWSGSIDVREGMVLVDSHYDYWRFTMKENAYACTNRYDAKSVTHDKTTAPQSIFQISEFSLFDAEGVRQNAELSAVGESASSQTLSGFAVTNLAPGEAAVENGTSFKYYLGTHDGHLPNLFDGTLGSGNAAGIVIYCKNGLPYLDKPTRHCKIIMRLPEGSSEIMHYGIANARGNGNSYFGRALTAYSLEASADGIFWEKVAENDEAEIPASASGWYNGTSMNGISRTVPLENVSAVRVAPGAKLVANGPVAPIRKLLVDAGGMGTIDGFEFTQSGILELSSLPSVNPVSIPVEVLNSETFANVGKWLVVHGDKVQKLSVRVGENGITLAKFGTTIVIR